jgi:two-component system, OmpR family, sensor kinase
MKKRLLFVLAAVAPVLLGTLLGLLLEQDILPNPVMVFSFEADRSALISRMGLLLTVGALLALGGVWLIQRRVQRDEDGARSEERETHRHFLRRLDHELKNPLAIIRVGVVNLQLSNHLPTEQRATLERMAQQAQRLQNLIQDLRWLSELEEGNLECSPVALQDVLEDAVDLALSDPRWQPDEISLSLQQVPWPLGTLMADHDMLVIAFRNLVDNALKYKAENSQVEVRATDDGITALIEIADRGPGIPGNEMPLIFDELYRGKQAKRVQGSGLGLTLVRRIIRLHSGHISVRSRVQHGTVMTVRLPLSTD